MTGNDPLDFCDPDEFMPLEYEEQKARQMTPAEIVAARKALGLTQAGMARVIDCDRSTLNRAENAKLTLHPAQERLIFLYLRGVRTEDWPTNRKQPKE